jgi:ABC-2 type transport system permease protein
MTQSVQPALPTLDRRPTHKVFPLFRSEVSRLTHRRLFRVLVLILFGGILLISGITFLSHSQDRAIDTSAAQARMDRAEARWQACVDDLGPSDNVRDFCGEDPKNQPLDTYDSQSDPRYKGYQLLPIVIIGTAVAAAGVAFLVGASSGGAEWSSRSMTLQLLFEPRRLRLLAVKWLALATTMAVTAALAILLSVGIGALTASRRGTWDSSYALVPYLRDHFTSQLVWAGLRGVFLVVIATTMGYAIAMLVRNTGASLGVAFVYFVVVENGVRFVFLTHGSEPYMLSSNSMASLFPGGLDLPGASNGASNTLSLVHVSNLRATLTMLAYCAVISVPAVWSFTRRDVS